MIAQNLILIVRRRLRRVPDADAYRTTHRQLENVRNCHAHVGFQTVRERVVERGICSLNRRRAEDRELPLVILIPGPVAVAIFIAAAEAYAMGTLRPIEIVGELVGALVAVLRDVHAVAEKERR